MFRFTLAYFYPWFDYLHILRHPDEHPAFRECFLKRCCSCYICDYLCPAETLVTLGCFGPHTTRLPGYAIIRLFLPTFYAMISMAILHILIGAIASYLLAKAVYMVSRSKTLFLFTFYYVWSKSLYNQVRYYAVCRRSEYLLCLNLHLPHHRIHDKTKQVLANILRPPSWMECLHGTSQYCPLYTLQHSPPPSNQRVEYDKKDKNRLIIRLPTHHHNGLLLFVSLHRNICITT